MVTLSSFEILWIIIFLLLAVVSVFILLKEINKQADEAAMQYNYVLHRLDFLLKKIGALDEYYEELEKNEKPWEVSEEKEKE